MEFGNLEYKLRETLLDLLNINYDNRHGPPYAFVQFHAFSRELPDIMRSMGLPDNQIDRIEGYRELFNEQLTERFTADQLTSFNNAFSELKEIFNRYCVHTELHKA